MHVSTRTAGHDASCVGCDPAFAAQLAQTMRRRLSDSTAGMSDACIVERVRAGVARAIRDGATSSSAISRYVLLMFALEPEFAQRRRVQEHIATRAERLDTALASLHANSHPNCWYRVAPSYVERRWQVLFSREDVFLHQSLKAEMSKEPMGEDLPPQLSPAYGYQLDVPYVATPEEQVLKMLELAQVGSDDTVVDLGSGDGRIVITAAAHFGARGIGIELNPDLVLEAQRAAARTGVEDRVSFHRRDLFDADVSEATVVTMYLLHNINVALRHRLLDQLRSGARIVSRHFDMGEWKPDLRIGSRAESIYCWHVP